MQAAEFIDKEIYVYQWRGKTKFEKARIMKFDKIKRNHSVMFLENQAESKVDFLKDIFYFAEQFSEDEIRNMGALFSSDYCFSYDFKISI